MPTTSQTAKMDDCKWPISGHYSNSRSQPEAKAIRPHLRGTAADEVSVAELTWLCNCPIAQAQ